MPDFELEQVDGEEIATIELPHGDTVIGRGPFLNVSDKRVSRNHGVLENVDGQLRLKPTHVNPCFVQTSEDASPQPLERDQWHQLTDGSIFSLLPGKYLYRVHALTERRTPRNSQGSGETDEEETKKEQVLKSSRSCEDTLAYTPCAKNCPSFTFETGAADPAACHKFGGDSHSCVSNFPDPLTHRKTRVLPVWMIATTPAVLNTSKATKRAPARRAQNTTTSSKSSAGPKRPRPKLPSSSEDEEEENRVAEDEDEEERCSKAPKKRARRLNSDPEESQDHAPASASSPERSQRDEDANAARKPDKRDMDKELKKADGSQVSNARGSTSTLENSGTSGANVQKAKVQQRTPCPFGTSCYRKNPIHFQECSHPGDNDYEEEQTNTDDDDRPECPYGTDCYRKNPLHKKEYKHTQPPAKMTTAVNDDDDEDEDQYENSFINDESEEDDIVEDSDYVPESEDSEKEDFKRLHKEAKAFLQKKKK